MTRRLTYLCRGTGWAHAARAALLLPELRERMASYTIDVAASGAAVDYFRMADIAHHDLDVPDELDHSGYAAHRISRYLDQTRPDAVLSDELCLAPLLCRPLKAPSVLIVCSFRHYRNGHAAVPAFDAADRILLATWPEVDEVPQALRHKVTAIGPIVRAENINRASARSALGLPADSLVVTVSFGQLHPLKRRHLSGALRAVLAAWRHAPPGATLLIPLSTETVHDLTRMPLTERGVEYVGPTPLMDKYHVASDAVLTLGGSTTSHAVRNGVPTVVLSRPDSIDWHNAAYLSKRTPLVTTTTVDEPGLELWERILGVAKVRDDGVDLRWGCAEDVSSALLATHV